MLLRVPLRLAALTLVTVMATIGGLLAAVRALVAATNRGAFGEQLAEGWGRVARWWLTSLGPTFIKAGQVLSSRRDILPEVCTRQLGLLRDQVRPMRPRQLTAALNAALGEKRNELRLQRVPLAAGAVAQVHAGLLPSGQRVALKVLRPGVAEALRSDYAILRCVAWLLTLLPNGKRVDPLGHLEHLFDALRRQLDLRIEAENNARFAVHFARSRAVRLPRVFPEYSNERVLCMELIEGQSLEQAARPLRRALSLAVQEAVLQMCFKDGFLHADLHSGNLRVDIEGRLVLLDVGLVAKLSQPQRAQLTDLARCIVAAPPSAFVEHIAAYHGGLAGVDVARLAEDARVAFEPLRRKPLMRLEFSELVGALLSVCRKHRVPPAPELVMVMVGLVTAEGIARQLNPELRVMQSAFAYLVELGRLGSAPVSVG